MIKREWGDVDGDRLVDIVPGQVDTCIHTHTAGAGSRSTVLTLNLGSC